MKDEPICEFSPAYGMGLSSNLAAAQQAQMGITNAVLDSLAFNSTPEHPDPETNLLLSALGAMESLQSAHHHIWETNVMAADAYQDSLPGLEAIAILLLAQYTAIQHLKRDVELHRADVAQAAKLASAVTAVAAEARTER
jgi:hypothetical protein